MKNMKTKAFTFVEIMIITVIIGLLVAMIIPACQTVRYNSLKNKVENGERLTPKQLESYRNMKKARESKPLTKVESDKPFKEITIDGQTFYLVPKE